MVMLMVVVIVMSMVMVMLVMVVILTLRADCSSKYLSDSNRPTLENQRNWHLRSRVKILAPSYISNLYFHPNRPHQLNLPC